MERHSGFAGRYAKILIGILVLLGLCLTALHSYLLFHSLAEMFSMMVAFGIFMLAWNSRRFLVNNYLLLIGIAYLFVGILDLFHTLAYKGMGVFADSGTNLAAQLWVGARYVESISLAIAPVMLNRKLNLRVAFGWYIAIVGFLLAAVFYWQIFPICFIEGAGLTSFKKLSEYIISGFLVLSLALLLKKRKEFDKNILWLMGSSIIIKVASEISFTLYTSAYGTYNLIGHLLKLVSFYLIYKAVIETGLMEPYEGLFRNLKQREQSVREERNRAQNYLDVAGVIIAVIGSDQKVRLLNKKGCEVLGYNEKEVIGKNWFDAFVPQGVREEIRAGYEKLISGQIESLEHESPVLTRTGEERVIGWSNTLLSDKDGNIIATLKSGEDVTDRKRMEKALQESEKKYRQLVESLREGIWVIDKDAYTTFVNPRMAEMLGYTTDEMLGKHLFTFMDENSVEVCKRNLERRQSGIKEQHDFEFIRKDGAKLYTTLETSPVIDNDGNYMGAIASVMDITERKKIEEEIKNLAKFPSENPGPVLRIARDGTILYANAASEELLRNWNCRAGERVPEHLRWIIPRVLKSQAAEELETVCGEQMFSLKVTPIAGAEYVNVYGADITKRKRAERDLQQYRRHLEDLVRARTAQLTEINRQLLQEIGERKRLEQEILHISEKEQRRIGQEMHDGLGQRLTGIAFLVKALRQKLAAKSLSEVAEVDEIASLLNGATNQTRILAKGLYPVQLTDDGLVSALHELACNTENLFCVSCRLMADESIVVRDGTVATNLYRIAQEAVTNAIKHGKAKHITIGLTADGEEATLTIQNDGVDFPEVLYESKGMGLQIMQYRASVINASLDISAAEGGGTIIRSAFPIRNNGERL